MIKKSVVRPSVDLVVALGDVKGLRTCVNYTRYRICMNMIEFVFYYFMILVMNSKAYAYETSGIPHINMSVSFSASAVKAN